MFFLPVSLISLCNRMRRVPMWLTEILPTLVPSSTTCGMENWSTTRSWLKKVFDTLLTLHRWVLDAWLCLICKTDGMKEKNVLGYTIFLVKETDQIRSIRWGSMEARSILPHLMLFLLEWHLVLQSIYVILDDLAFTPEYHNSVWKTFLKLLQLFYPLLFYNNGRTVNS